MNVCSFYPLSNSADDKSKELLSSLTYWSLCKMTAMLRTTLSSAIFKGKLHILIQISRTYITEGPNGQYLSTGPGNDLAEIIRQAITWTNVYHFMTPLGVTLPQYLFLCRKKEALSRQGQVITSHSICGMLFLFPAIDTCFRNNTTHIETLVPFGEIGSTIDRKTVNFQSANTHRPMITEQIVIFLRCFQKYTLKVKRLFLLENTFK